MKWIIDFVAKHSDKVWTFFSTVLGIVVGAVCTYLTTARAEIRKEKRSRQYAKVESIYIPYCTATEKALDSFDAYKTIDITQLKEDLVKPLAYLRAEKRVYLSKNQRDKLEKYEEAVKPLLDNLSAENKELKRKYCLWMAEQLKDSPYSTGLGIEVSLRGEESYETDILRKTTPPTMIYSISGITFIQNDEPDNYRTIDVHFDKNTWYIPEQIEQGYATIEDFEDEDRLAGEVAEILNRIDDKKKIESLIQETTTNDQLFRAGYIAAEIRNNLIKEIDKITQ